MQPKSYKQKKHKGKTSVRLLKLRRLEINQINHGKKQEREDLITWGLTTPENNVWALTKQNLENPF